MAEAALSIYSIKNQFISSETINVIIRTYMKSKWQIRKKSLLTIIAKWFFAPHFNASFLYFGNTNSTQHGQGFLPINHSLSKAHLLFQCIAICIKNIILFNKHWSIKKLPVYYEYSQECIFYFQHNTSFVLL